MATIQQTVTNTVNIKVCDICGGRTNSLYGKICFSCGKDICDNCFCYVEYLHDFSQSKPSCKICASKLGKYKDLAYLIEEKAYSNIEKLIEKWREECKNG